MGFYKKQHQFFSECVEWHKIVLSTSPCYFEDPEFLQIAADLLPEEPFKTNSWDEWIASITKKTGKKGKELFMPLRMALTGKEKGPELKYLLPLLSKNNILKKL